MQLRAIAMARWVLPVPVPPTRTALRCWAMKPPLARSLTNTWLMGVPSNWKSSRSLASGSLAMVSWYLIERACFSLISALSRSPTMRCGSCWRLTQGQCGRGEDRGRWTGIALASQNVENDIGGMDAVGERLGAGSLDGGQAVGQHRVEDIDHLPVAVGGARELAPHTFHRGRQHPILEGSTVAQGAGLAGQDRHVMPGIVGRLAAAEGAKMLGNDAPVLADYNAVGIGMHLDRAPNRARRHRVFVVVEAHQAGLRDRCRHCMESIEPAGIGNELWPFRLEHLPDCLLGQFWMAVRLGVGDAFIEQPGVQLIIVFEPQPRREEALTDQPDLVLDLPLLPARRRRAGDRIDEVMAAHLQELSIVETLLADEDGRHRRLHVVVDAALACALEQGECPVVGVEHHLLRLARISSHKQHAAMAEPDVRHLHGHRRAVQQDDLVAPVELVGFTRREAQRHIGRSRRGAALLAPPSGVAPHGVVAAGITAATQFLEQADQRQALPRRLTFIRRQQLIELVAPRSDPRKRLRFPLITELSRLRSDDLPHALPGNTEITAYRLDRLTVDKIRATDLSNRLHDQHSNLGSHENGSQCGPSVPGVPIGCRSPRKRGPYSMPKHNLSFRP